MAIDLPPAMPPLEATATSVEVARAGAAGKVTAQAPKFRVEVVAPRLLPASTIRRAVESAQSPSQAVLKLNDAYRRAGHLLVSLHYAMVETTLSIFVIQGELADVISPPALEKFFEPLIGDDDLTVAEFDRRRIMADIKASRAGQSVGISYRVDPAAPAQVTLLMTSEPVEDYDGTDLSVEIGNPGNRFLGRYFQNTAIRHTTDYGTEFVVGWESALPELGENTADLFQTNPPPATVAGEAEGQRYDGFQVAMDHPTVYGLYGFDLEHTRYAIKVRDLNGQVVNEVEAAITSLGLNGKQTVVSNQRNKINLFQRLEHVELETDLRNNPRQEDEPHSTVELGFEWYHLFPASEVTWALSFSAEAGLSSNAGTLQTDSTKGAVSAGRRNSRFVALRPKFGVSIPLFDTGAWTFDLIAQSANRQLPQEQQWVLGGMEGLSAYLPGVLVGDSGYYAITALNFGRWAMGSGGLTLSLFVETGSAEYEDVDAAVAGTQADRSSIADGGVRLEADLGWDMEFELVAARNISDNNIDERVLEAFEADFYFRLSKTF